MLLAVENRDRHADRKTETETDKQRQRIPQCSSLTLFLTASTLIWWRQSVIYTSGAVLGTAVELLLAVENRDRHADRKTNRDRQTEAENTSMFCLDLVSNGVDINLVETVN